MRVWLTIMLMVLLLTVPGAVTAQDDSPPAVEIPITVGEPVQGALSNETPLLHFTFEAAAGDVLYASALRLSDSYFGIKLALLNAAGEIIAEPDDPYARIEVLGPVTIPADGSYAIQVQGRYAGDNGNFMMLLDRADTVALESGMPFEETLTLPGETRFFTVESAGGEVLALTTTGSALQWAIVDPQGEEIRGRGPDVDPAIDFVLLSWPGTYHITLRHESLQESPVTLRADIDTPQEIAPGVPVEGLLTPDDPEAHYRVEVPEGTLRLELVVPDGVFSGPLSVYDGSGQRLESIYGSDDPEYARLVDPWLPPHAGDYYLHLKGDPQKLAEPLPYTLAVRESDTGVLVPGEVVVGVIDNTHPYTTYILTGAAGERLRLSVTVTEGTCTPRLTLESGTEKYLDMLDNLVATTLTLDLTLPEATSYELIVNRGDFGDDCTYDLLIERLE